MGIDTSATSPFPKARLFRSKGLAALQLLQASAREWARDFGPVFTSGITGNRLTLSLFPFGGDIRITSAPEGITATFRSSVLGAGFHVAAVDLLEHLAQRHDMAWAWQDESGYAPGRHLGALRHAMARFVDSLARMGYTKGLMCLDTDLAQARPGLIGPLGPLTPDFDAQSLHAWPEPGLTPQTWARLLRAALWQGPWGPPTSDAEAAAAAAIRHLAERAGALPEDLLAALAEWRQAQTTCPRPRAHGIGYRRGMRPRELATGLTMELPGQARQMTEEGRLRYIHPDFWLGVVEMTGKGPLSFPPDFQGPDLPVGALALRRRASADKAVSVAIHRPGAPRAHLVILTLATEEAWVLKAFDAWLETVRASDLFA